MITADQVKLTTNARATSTAALNCEKTFTSDSNGRLFSRQFSKYKLDSILGVLVTGFYKRGVCFEISLNPYGVDVIHLLSESRTRIKGQ